LRHDVLVQLPDLFFDESHVLQTVTDHLPVVIAYAMAFQRRDDLWDLLLGTPQGKLRDLRWLRLALEQRIQHLFRLSWKWRERSAVKITERTREETKKALHGRREGRHLEATLAGTGAGFQAL
jgi:hypothetical protein